ncbi:unnamed protein product [Brassica rapa]|uniref:Uncharacterized protein n=2 Tax=Brassica TaxID=3705 RepID=A0A3P6CMN5_BRACM|nr:unnamed protein product [Brassica napus]CAG7908410.1 unnamed protein product [Brassica rapa]VDD15830.1 unnamed protein product [Brassica rapa]
MYDIRELQEVAPCGCNKRLRCSFLNCLYYDMDRSHWPS